MRAWIAFVWVIVFVVGANHSIRMRSERAMLTGQVAALKRVLEGAVAENERRIAPLEQAAKPAPTQEPARVPYYVGFTTLQSTPAIHSNNYITCESRYLVGTVVQ